jgi:hypothetical protein
MAAQRLKQDLSNTPACPPALLLAEAVDQPKVAGYYDVSTDTWSDRVFALAGCKKHNEQM